MAPGHQVRRWFGQKRHSVPKQIPKTGIQHKIFQQETRQLPSSLQVVTEVPTTQVPTEVPAEEPIQPVTQLPIGVRLANFSQVWEEITDQPWVLQTVKGLRWRFSKEPPFSPPPRPRALSFEKEKAIDNEVQALLGKKAVEPTNATEGFFSNIFPVPKKHGGWRPVIDLHALNAFIPQEHFKMEAVVNLKDKGRLADENRLEGRLLDGPSSPQPQEVSEIQLEGPALPMQDSSVWSFHSSTHLQSC